MAKIIAKKLPYSIKKTVLTFFVYVVQPIQLPKHKTMFSYICIIQTCQVITTVIIKEQQYLYDVLRMKKSLIFFLLFCVLLGSIQDLTSHSGTVQYRTALDNQTTGNFYFSSFLLHTCNTNCLQKQSNQYNITVNNKTMYYDIIYIQVIHPWTGENKMGDRVGL